VLTSDELGEAGETLFANLCVRAGFTCNKSNRDRTGWDFVVELPMAGPDAGALDARLPTACAVQLKSTASAGPVKLSLSSIERLAKDPRPAFVVVLRLTPEGEPRTGYLIHLLGPALARVRPCAGPVRPQQAHDHVRPGAVRGEVLALARRFYRRTAARVRAGPRCLQPGEAAPAGL